MAEQSAPALAERIPSCPLNYAAKPTSKPTSNRNLPCPRRPHRSGKLCAKCPPSASRRRGSNMPHSSGVAASHGRGLPGAHVGAPLPLPPTALRARTIDAVFCVQHSSSSPVIGSRSWRATRVVGTWPTEHDARVSRSAYAASVRRRPVFKLRARRPNSAASFRGGDAGPLACTR